VLAGGDRRPSQAELGEQLHPGACFPGKTDRLRQPGRIKSFSDFLQGGRGGRFESEGNGVGPCPLQKPEQFVVHQIGAGLALETRPGHLLADGGGQPCEPFPGMGEVGVGEPEIIDPARPEKKNIAGHIRSRSNCKEVLRNMFSRFSSFGLL
jgi:hypothetical protein